MSFLDFFRPSCTVEVTFQNQSCQSVFSTLSSAAHKVPTNSNFLSDVRGNSYDLWFTHKPQSGQGASDLTFEFATHGNRCSVWSWSRAHEVSWSSNSQSYCTLLNHLSLLNDQKALDDVNILSCDSVPDWQMEREVCGTEAFVSAKD